MPALELEDAASGGVPSQRSDGALASSPELAASGLMAISAALPAASVPDDEFLLTPESAASAPASPGSAGRVDTNLVTLCSMFLGPCGTGTFWLGFRMPSSCVSDHPIWWRACHSKCSRPSGEDARYVAVVYIVCSGCELQYPITSAAISA